MRYAENTSVSIEKSKGEIERTLVKYGATKFVSGWDTNRAMIMFSMDDKNLRFIIPMPSKETFKKTDTGRVRKNNAIEIEFEKAQRQSWRALNLVIKAKLESVSAGICMFEEEFLPHFVTSNGQTVAERMLPDLPNLLQKESKFKLLGE